MQGKWDEAIAAWRNVIQHMKLTEEEIQSGHFKRSYDVDICIYSLGVAYCLSGNKQQGKFYLKVVREDPGILTYPVGKIDYTQWGSYVGKQAPKWNSRGRLSRLLGS
jgi:hypothetical protein